MKEFRRSLFLETFVDLRSRIRPGTSAYRVLRMCLLMRQLIGKHDSLAEEVAAEHGLPAPLYRYRRINVPARLMLDWESGIDHKAIDPDVHQASDITKASPHLIPVATQKIKESIDFSWINWLDTELYNDEISPVIESRAPDFRKAGLAAFANGTQIIIENLIDYISYCMGGIHGVRRKKDVALQATGKLVGHGLTTYRVRGVRKPHDDILSALQVIGSITLKGMQPLYNELKGSTRNFVMS